MIYFELDSETQAESISRLLYSLVSPRNVDTIYLFGWVKHPSSGKVLVELNDEEDHPNHRWDDRPQILDQIGQALGDVADPDDLRNIAGYIGLQDRIHVSQIIPAVFKNAAVTRAQAKAMGYYPDPS